MKIMSFIRGGDVMQYTTVRDRILTILLEISKRPCTVKELQQLIYDDIGVMPAYPAIMQDLYTIERYFPIEAKRVSYAMTYTLKNKLGGD